MLNGDHTMKQNEMFANAQWVCAGTYQDTYTHYPNSIGTPLFPILRSHFSATNVHKATLRVVGLGFFHCYVNGTQVSKDFYLPLATDYEERPNYPIDEKLTGHRLYVPEYDVTKLLCDGDNTIAIHFGGGWYTFREYNYDFEDTTPHHYGNPKAIFSLTLETDQGTVVVGSSAADKIGDSFVKGYHFTYMEYQDFTQWDDQVLGNHFDDSQWSNAIPTEGPDTEYLFSDCPPDRILETLPVTVIRGGGFNACYDTGRNCSGFPILRLNVPKGQRVLIRMSEEVRERGEPDLNFHFGQTLSFISDGTDRIVFPQFTWFCFRYFQVIGGAEVLGVAVVHSDVPVTSNFSCSNETVNWLYRAYVNTQLSNMHGGIPSDCPHIERRGYTGDGQLTCHAAMDTLDAEAFYRKWIDDISDCQDLYTGRIQHTAPYTRSGGGIGGWGCAIVEVPYQYYKHYGNPEPLHRLYSQMLRYLDYVEAGSEDGLVVRAKPNCSNLGDWCTLDPVAIPEPFVNTYFYIKVLTEMTEIASVTGHEQDLPVFLDHIAQRKAALVSHYYDPDTGDFLQNIQGTNAYALDIGLGSEKTLSHLTEKYRELGHFDTGIFGTNILTRVLFATGNADLAFDLLASQHPSSFDGMRRANSTSLWEYWPNSTWDRSHNHPMFGAVVAYLFDYVLGIQAKDGCAGYSEIQIAPFIPTALNRAAGHRTLPNGEVHVSWKKSKNTISFEIEIPESQSAEFVYQNNVYPLNPGKNLFEFSL